MPEFEVRKSIVIDKPQSELIEFLSDFENWPSWSPWLVLEPECHLDFKGNHGRPGSSYSWDGHLVGSGNMTLTYRSADSLKMALQFIKPFKSRAIVTMDVVTQNQVSTLTWGMKSSMPWFLFFMTNMMKNIIGMDYDRGLTMLKAKLETGEVNTNLSIKGKRRQQPIQYIGIEGSAIIPEIGPVMRNDFLKLSEFLKSQNLEPAGPAFTIYYDMDMSSTRSVFRNCIPVSDPVTPDSPMLFDTLEEAETYVVNHTGEYQFMGNAWALAMQSSRSDKIKLRKKPKGMEIYVSDPDQTEPRDLISEVALFVR